MRPGSAFAQHAPQHREQRRIYEQVDASNTPIFFCIISPDIALPDLYNSFTMLSGETAIIPRQHHLFLLQVQMPENQRNKAIFIIAISFANHWLSTNFMSLYAL